MTARTASSSLILLAFLAFISLGLPDTLLGVAWPTMRAQFARPISSLGILLTCSTSGYLLSSFCSGLIVPRIGVGWLLTASCAVVVVSLTTYAISPSWWLLLPAAFAGGIGAGAIDAGINAFGAKAFTPRVLNWLHACWGIGASAGPIIMTSVLALQASYRVGYGIVASIMVAMTILFFVTRRAWTDRVSTDGVAPLQPHASMRESVAQPLVVGQALFYVLYGGVEASAGNWIYTLLTESRNVSVEAAGATVSVFWGSITAGRIVFGQVAHHLRGEAVLRIGMIGAIAGAVLFHSSMPLAATLVGACLLGLMLAPTYPTLMALTPERVGERFAVHAVALQVSGCGLGVALIPALVGIAARRFGIEILPGVLIGGTIALLALHNLLDRAVDSRSNRRALRTEP